MTFVQKFKPEDFLDVLDPRGPRTTSFVMLALQCSRNTAIKFLSELEAEGRVKKQHIEGGNFGWVRVETEESDKESLICMLSIWIAEHQNSDELVKKVREFIRDLK